MERAKKKLVVVVPLTLVGGIWLTWWLGYNTSVAAAVHFIARPASAPKPVS